jgi:hypothetical protein
MYIVDPEAVSYRDLLEVMTSSSSDGTAAAIDFAEEGRAPAEEEGQPKLSQLAVPQVAWDQDVVEDKSAALCLFFMPDEDVEGKAAPAAQASAAELDAASSETEKQAVAEKSEVLEAEGEATPAAQAPVAELDAASSIAAAKAKSRPRPSGPGQGEIDQHAAVAEKSAEEIRAEAKPRLDVCFLFATLLLYLFSPLCLVSFHFKCPGGSRSRCRGRAQPMSLRTDCAAGEPAPRRQRHRLPRRQRHRRVRGLSCQFLLSRRLASSGGRWTWRLMCLLFVIV